jgi:hypothetical protein
MLPVRINRKDNTAVITFNTEFYDHYYLTEVCERFEDICRIKLIFDQDRKQIIAKITPKVEEDIEEIACEFANWALHLQAKGV